MADVNKVTLIGRLGKDPELKEGKVTLCKFSVATTDKRSAEKTTEWHNVVCFGKTAEFCAKYLTKGREVYVEGRISSREYEKDGHKQRWFEIVANDVQAIGGKKDEGGGRGPVNEIGDNERLAAGGGGKAARLPDDDIPFAHESFADITAEAWIARRM